VGEGLVGLVAERAAPLKLRDARNHPNFAYRPETGEDLLYSFLGVPIIRGGRVRGVLVTQHQSFRTFGENDIEILATIAMVVAELIADGSPLASNEVVGLVGDTGGPVRIAGQGLSVGYGRGVAVVCRPQVRLTELVADDPEREWERIGEALGLMNQALDRLSELTRDTGKSETQDILETYRMLAGDRGWLRKIREAIYTGLSAEAAVQQVMEDTRVRMLQLPDSYIRERLLDIDDITHRLLSHLAGQRGAAEVVSLPDQIVLVARALGPADLLDYNQARIRGVVMEEGSVSSHVCIVARALGIPVVGRCADAMSKIDPYDPLIVDGYHGLVFVRPDDDIIGSYEAAAAAVPQAPHGTQEATGPPPPAVTLDGVSIDLKINAGMLVDLSRLVSVGASGVGLYRTEIPFMVAERYPDVIQQRRLYESVLNIANGRPVTFRTLDVGGDKRLPYFPDLGEENPALGWRALRMGLDRPAMLRTQLRALVLAAGDTPVRILFPMVATVEEFERARGLALREINMLQQTGAIGTVAHQIGAMIEIPSLVLDLDRLLSRTRPDFLCLGTNDLLQYAFAIDRGNPRVAARYDALSPPFLRLLASIATTAGRAGVELTVCGEMAGRPLEALSLIGLGFNSLSMNPPQLAAVRAAVRSLHAAQLQIFMAQVLDSENVSVRAHIVGFLMDNGIPLISANCSGS
jgi:phosphotransferase system enzyme I (PtsP)